MRNIVLVCIVMLWGSTVTAEELRLIVDTQETWTARVRPTAPETEGESLALQAAVAHTAVKQGILTATPVGHKNNCDIVTVEESEDEGMCTVKSYEVCRGKISAETREKFVTKPNPEREQIARNVAAEHLRGNKQTVPVMFNGRMFIADYDGKCLITIHEKDRDTVHYSYRYNSCD